MTDLDPETQSILLKRLHPWINNFNDLILFLFCCNMDIKFIGSGEPAKALVYYVTDYITKSQLPTHVGLAAVLYAIWQNDVKFEGLVGSSLAVNRSLFTKTINTIMARQEVSHTQVMSYLVGGGDYYCSHSFWSLKWQNFDRWITASPNIVGTHTDNTPVDTEIDVNIDPNQLFPLLMITYRRRKVALILVTC
ncbi:hypothetical protein SERLA73DRAFT_56115 [Serpula lacrymans var. lacrymans S7.3]|uniref:Uncharacterized protein n=1 Tax=Serpula lacrymans var. lacrymans (strain S7.3) TaxID=936435 RepID=F8Q1M2_SERL3|nr:hypothetical protein SERLA73DRAFT_56115 [Serpula lacrymans var. lacrymans S7.3]